jgi:type VII secretion protein EccE
VTAPGAAQPPEWQQQSQPATGQAAVPQAQPPTIGYAGPAAPVRAYASAPTPARGYAIAPARSSATYGAAKVAPAEHVAAAAAAAQAAAAQAAAAQEAAARAAAAQAAAGRGRQAQARESHPAATRPAPAEPRRSPTSRGALRVAQFLCWQIAAAAVLAAYRVGMVAAVVVAAVALPLLVPMTIRVRGRWLYQWLGLWLRFRTRRHQVPATGGGPALDLLTFAEQSAALDSVELDGRDIALLTHRGGLCAVFELGPDEDALLVDEAVTLPSPAALLPAADEQTPPVSAQLLIAVSPAPLVAGLGAVDRSYRELSGGEVPAHRRAWLVVQGLRTPEAFTDPQLRPAVVSAVRRARRHLRQEKVAARLLDQDELLAAVAHLARLSAPTTAANASNAAAGSPNPAAGSPNAAAGAPKPARNAPNPVRNAPDPAVDAPAAANVYGAVPPRKAARETWRAWWSEDAPQSCHRLVRRPTQPWHIDTLLRQLPAIAGVLSLAVTRDRSASTGGDDLAVEVAFRLAAADLTALGNGDRALDAALRSRGGRIERLDGEQVSGLAATLPLGGFLR